MNVWEKLNLARIKMMQQGIKETGKGAVGNTFFELKEILPASNRICAEIKTTIYCIFTNEKGILFFVDCEKPEDVIVFELPMRSAKLPNCHDVQNLGAAQTYLKRYLYCNCYELSDNEILDKDMLPPAIDTDGLTEEEKKLEKLLRDNEQVLGKGKIGSPYATAMQVLVDGGDVQAMIERTEDYLKRKKEAKHEPERKDA